MASKLFDLTGRVALVTGSSRGIGRAIAEALAAHGAKVVITSRKADACEAAVAEITAQGGDAMAIPCNVSDRDQLKNLVDETHKAWGQIDILVCNAGVSPYLGPSLEMPDEAFEKVMDVNVKSVLWLCALVAPDMRERRAGSIIIVSSVCGLIGNRDIGAYGISKAADMQIARNLAVELGPDNIRVNTIAPGLVKTDFARALWENPDLAGPIIESTPLKRLGEPQDIAGVAVLLAADAGSWITGQTIVVDGGDTVSGF